MSNEDFWIERAKVWATRSREWRVIATISILGNIILALVCMTLIGIIGIITSD